MEKVDPQNVNSVMDIVEKMPVWKRTLDNIPCFHNRCFICIGLGKK